MAVNDDEYVDHPVRPYVRTAGRAYPTRNTLRPETLLVVVPGVRQSARTARQERDVLAVCQGMLSLAEVAAHLRLPVSLVAVTVSDLLDAGLLAARSGSPGHEPSSRDLLEKLLNGLRKL